MTNEPRCQRPLGLVHELPPLSTPHFTTDQFSEDDIHEPMIAGRGDRTAAMSLSPRLQKLPLRARTRQGIVEPSPMTMKPICPWGPGLRYASPWQLLGHSHRLADRAVNLPVMSDRLSMIRIDCTTSIIRTKPVPRIADYRFRRDRR